MSGNLVLSVGARTYLANHRSGLYGQLALTLNHMTDSSGTSGADGYDVHVMYGATHGLGASLGAGYVFTPRIDVRAQFSYLGTGENFAGSGIYGYGETARMGVGLSAGYSWF